MKIIIIMYIWGMDVEGDILNVERVRYAKFRAFLYEFLPVILNVPFSIIRMARAFLYAPLQWVFITLAARAGMFCEFTYVFQIIQGISGIFIYMGVTLGFGWRSGFTLARSKSLNTLWVT